MSDLDKTHPEFTISIRGYDRIQVDDYIQRLSVLLAEATERARAAESELEFSRHMTVGPRVSQIFELAVAEAKELRARVEEEERTRLETARQQAEEIIETARRAADEVAAESQRQYDAMVAKMDAEREVATAVVNRLEDQKAQMLAELRRLHEALGRVAEFSVAAPKGTEEEQARDEDRERNENRERDEDRGRDENRGRDKDRGRPQAA
jgi:cell division septum initiation protein DivIVA